MSGAEILADLRASLPRPMRASVEPADQVAYGRDLWPRHHLDVRAGRVGEHRAGVIVWPESTDDVRAVVRWARAKKVPVVPFGAGSGVCGGVLASPGVVVLDLKRMSRWRAFDPDAPSVDVEAGALGLPFEEELNRRGFTLGHFPSSILCSTVGGWVAARSAGQCSGAYGKIEDMVVRLECVTGEGDVVTLDRRPHGPDLTPLVIGSEGTLAVVTAATLRLHPLPRVRAFGAFTFPDTEAGWTGMRVLFQDGLRPAVSRLYDPFDAMLARMGGVKGRRSKQGKTERTEAHAPRAPGMGARALRQVLRRPGALNELVDRVGGPALGGAMLVLVFEGDGDGPSRAMARARELLEARGGRFDGEEPARRWMAHRYAVSYRQSPVWASGAWVDTMEVAATWANLPALYEGVRRALGREAFVMAHLSHAYPDGCCIYFSFAGSARPSGTAEAWDAASVGAYERAWSEALRAAEEAGGTIAHHHGVGRSKAPRLGKEAGEGVRVVRALKRAFDPDGILNPGNLLPPEDPPKASTGPSFKEGRRMHLDRVSMLVEVSGEVPLGALEAWLGQEGLTVGVAGAAASGLTVNDWVASGTPGAHSPWNDPADHLVAGFVAELRDGSPLVVRPAPRRSVGPDLFALLSGVNGQFASLVRVWIRVHEVGARVVTTSTFHEKAETKPNEGEERLLARVAAVL